MSQQAATTTKIFRSGRNQAIRIPVELSFATETVTIEKRGDALIVRPIQPQGWERFFGDESLVLPEDFEPPADPAPQDGDFYRRDGK